MSYEIRELQSSSFNIPITQVVDLILPAIIIEIALKCRNQMSVTD
jgi:hypothetical protein